MTQEESTEFGRGKRDFRAHGFCFHEAISSTNFAAPIAVTLPAPLKTDLTDARQSPASDFSAAAIWLLGAPKASPNCIKGHASFYSSNLYNASVNREASGWHNTLKSLWAIECLPHPVLLF